MKVKLQKLLVLLVISLLVACTSEPETTSQPQSTSNKNQDVQETEIMEEDENVQVQDEENQEELEESKEDSQEEVADDQATSQENSTQEAQASGLNQAVQEALADLGTNENQALVTQMSFDLDRGDTDTYEVDIYMDGVEYQYKFDQNMQLINKSQENEDDNPFDSNFTYISAQRVLNLALEQAGLAESDIVELSIDLEADDYVYEVEVESKDQSREFVLDAVE